MIGRHTRRIVLSVIAIAAVVCVNSCSRQNSLSETKYFDDGNISVEWAWSRTSGVDADGDITIMRVVVRNLALEKGCLLINAIGLRLLNASGLELFEKRLDIGDSWPLFKDSEQRDYRFSMTTGLAHDVRSLDGEFRFIRGEPLMVNYTFPPPDFAPHWNKFSKLECVEP